MTKDTEKGLKVGPRASIFLVLVVATLGGCACAAGIYAEIIKTKKVKPQTGVGQVLECEYQKSLVKLIGLGGAGALAIGQMLISAAGGCVYCPTLLYAKGRAHKASVVLFTLAWVVFFMAELCFLAGAYVNEWHRSETRFIYDYELRTCFSARHGAYFAAAAASLLSSFLSILYYGEAERSKYEAWVEQGAPTPRLYSIKSMRSFVIAGPAKRGSLKGTENDEGGEYEEENEDDDVSLVPPHARSPTLKSRARGGGLPRSALRSNSMASDRSVMF